jgi:hypothetical protein
MTAVDLLYAELAFPFTLRGGQVNLKTTMNTGLNELGQPGLPNCTTVELLDANVVDEIGRRFASMGIFLPAH